MRLIRLATAGFRNLRAGELHTDAQFVLLVGQNAQGKTNTLEAIYVLATLRPLRARRTAELIAWGGTEAGIAGDVRSEAGVHKHRVDFGPQGRKVTLDGERTELGPYFEGIRVVAFTPADGDIVLGEPKGRRAWLDRAAFTRSPAHLDVVRTFRRTLAQKSALLKEGRFDHQVLQVLDHQLAREGARLAHRRAGMVAELGPHVRAMHQAIAGSDIDVGIRYRTSARGETVEAREKALTDAIAEHSAEEQRRRMVLVGPQRDDVAFALAGKATRSFGSRGQVRSLVLALKLAELVAARERGRVPMFLLDDVSSELDRERTRRLVGLLSELGTQVFATTTDPDHVEGLPPADTLRYTVDDGALV